MVLIAAVLAAGLSIEFDLTALLQRARQKSPGVTCGISTVGYRFIGRAGQRFRYSGETFIVPDEGWVELIADPRRKSFAFEGRTIDIEMSPADPFGFRDVPLPAPETIPEVKP
jgi:hypothetical protein